MFLLLLLLLVGALLLSSSVFPPLKLQLGQDVAVSTLDQGLVKFVRESVGLDSPSDVAADSVLATIEECKGDVDQAIAQVSEQVMMRVAADHCSVVLLAAAMSGWRARARRDAVLRDAVAAFSARISVERAQRLVRGAAESLFASTSMKIASRRHAKAKAAQELPEMLSGKLRPNLSVLLLFIRLFSRLTFFAGPWCCRVACRLEAGQGAEGEGAEGRVCDRWAPPEAGVARVG